MSSRLKEIPSHKLAFGIRDPQHEFEDREFSDDEPDVYYQTDADCFAPKFWVLQTKFDWGKFVVPTGAFEQEGDAFESFTSCIEQSRSILDLPEDWDDNGAPVFSEAHWKRVSEFLLSAVAVIWGERRRLLRNPTINPVSDGSIDIHWNTNSGELLINVPSNGTEATFYGDNFGMRKIKGTLELTADDFPLLIWLKLVE